MSAQEDDLIAIVASIELTRAKLDELRARRDERIRQCLEQGFTHSRLSQITGLVPCVVS